ncbi:hypothetical protein LTR10_014970 [Elasticomyces elasticus]|nr:hypothetical protein LTR10_014970 [Elasticomyces elasticus]
MNDTRDNSKNDSMEAKKLRRAKSVKKAKVAQMAKKKARPAATNRLENYYCTWKTTEEVASPELGTVEYVLMKSRLTPQPRWSALKFGDF